MLTRTVFLDRDGVINYDSPDYIKSWEEFRFLPGSLAAIRRLTRHGFTIIVITNQSAIARNMITPDGLETIHRNMKTAVASHGGRITDIFFCPHLPEDGCDCRKPRPGMIQNALKHYDIDLSRAYMVGDSAKDIQCARNAACGGAVLVRTGNGMKTERALKDGQALPDYTAENLLEAADWIIRQQENVV